MAFENKLVVGHRYPTDELGATYGLKTSPAPIVDTRHLDARSAIVAHIAQIRDVTDAPKHLPVADTRLQVSLGAVKIPLGEQPAKALAGTLWEAMQRGAPVEVATGLLIPPSRKIDIVHAVAPLRSMSQEDIMGLLARGRADFSHDTPVSIRPETLSSELIRPGVLSEMELEHFLSLMAGLSPEQGSVVRRLFLPDSDAKAALLFDESLTTVTDQFFTNILPAIIHSQKNFNAIRPAIALDPYSHLRNASAEADELIVAEFEYYDMLESLDRRTSRYQNESPREVIENKLMDEVQKEFADVMIFLCNVIDGLGIPTDNLLYYRMFGGGSPTSVYTQTDRKLIGRLPITEGLKRIIEFNFEQYSPDMSNATFEVQRRLAATFEMLARYAVLAGWNIAAIVTKAQVINTYNYPWRLCMPGTYGHDDTHDHMTGRQTIDPMQPIRLVRMLRKGYVTEKLPGGGLQRYTLLDDYHLHFPPQPRLGEDISCREHGDEYEAWFGEWVKRIMDDNSPYKIDDLTYELMLQIHQVHEEGIYTCTDEDMQPWIGGSDGGDDEPPYDIYAWEDSLS